MPTLARLEARRIDIAGSATGHAAKLVTDVSEMGPDRVCAAAPPRSRDRWVDELDRHGVERTADVASIPGDEASVATAVARHPTRCAGAFMFNPTAPDIGGRLGRAFGEHGLRCACLFPAMRVNPG